MSRSAAFVFASLLVCGCQTSGQPLGSLPFGSQRIPPPGTNSYPNPNISYPNGANPAGGVGPAGTTSSPNSTPNSLSPNSLFNSRPQAGFTPTSGNGWPAENTQPGIRFGDNRAPAASSAIRLNGMPVNDATRPPMARANASTAGIPELTDASRGNGYPTQPAGYLSPLPTSYPPYNSPYGASPQYYAPGSIGSTTSSSSLGWKSKTPPVGPTGSTSLR